MRIDVPGKQNRRHLIQLIKPNKIAFHNHRGPPILIKTRNRPQLETQPPNHQHVGKPNLQALGHVPRIPPNLHATPSPSPPRHNKI
jgi:hypothetical protein